MSKFNVNTNHKAGRRTQVMMDQFADFAVEANNKLIDKVTHTESKVEKLKEILAVFDIQLKKTDYLTMGPHLQDIFNKITEGTNELADYVHDIEKHRKHHV